MNNRKQIHAFTSWRLEVLTVKTAILFKENDAACKFIAKLQSQDNAKIGSTSRIQSEKLIGLLQSRSLKRCTLRCWRQYTVVHSNLMTHHTRCSIQRDKQLLRMSYESFRLNLATSRIQSEKLIGLLQSRSLRRDTLRCWRQYTTEHSNLAPHCHLCAKQRNRLLMRMAYEFFKRACVRRLQKSRYRLKAINQCHNMHLNLKRAWNGWLEVLAESTVLQQKPTNDLDESHQIIPSFNSLFVQSAGKKSTDSDNIEFAIQEMSPRTDPSCNNEMGPEPSCACRAWCCRQTQNRVDSDPLLHREISKLQDEMDILFRSILESSNRLEAIVDLLGSRVSKMMQQLFFRDCFIQELQRSILNRSDRSVTWIKVMGDWKREVQEHQLMERDPRLDVLADIVSLRKTVDVLKESIAIHEETIQQLITKRDVSSSSWRSSPGPESCNYFLADLPKKDTTGDACHRSFVEQEDTCIAPSPSIKAALRLLMVCIDDVCFAVKGAAWRRWQQVLVRKRRLERVCSRSALGKERSELSRVLVRLAMNARLDMLVRDLTCLVSRGALRREARSLMALLITVWRAMCDPSESPGRGTRRNRFFFS